jgi:hypothetical protein
MQITSFQPPGGGSYARPVWEVKIPVSSSLSGSLDGLEEHDPAVPAREVAEGVELAEQVDICEGFRRCSSGLGSLALDRNNQFVGRVSVGVTLPDLRQTHRPLPPVALRVVDQALELLELHLSSPLQR